MKKFLKPALTALLFVQSLPLGGYTISHNGDSELEKVTILVFPSEENFEKLLKNQGITAQQLAKITGGVRNLLAEGSLLSSIMSFDPETMALIRGISTSIAAAAKYSGKPLDWLKTQNLTLAIHKNVERNNQGEGAKWHWKKIKEDHGIDHNNPNGLFVVFIDPKTKEILLVTPLSSSSRIGFSAVRDPETGILIGTLAPFEKDLETLAKMRKSTFSRLYDYVKNSRTLRDTVRILKKKFISFIEKPGSGEKMVKFLSGELSDQMSKLSTEIKKMDSATALSQVKPIFNFFREEIEKTKESVKGDTAAEQLLDNTINKFNFFKDAVEEVIVNPIETYREVTSPLTEEGIESELSEFHALGDDIEPIAGKTTEKDNAEEEISIETEPISIPTSKALPIAPTAVLQTPVPALPVSQKNGTVSGPLRLPIPPAQRIWQEEEESATNDEEWD